MPGLPDAVVVHLPGRVARGAVELVGAEFVIGDGAIAVAVEQAHVVRAVRTVVDGREDAGGVARDDRPGAGPAGAGGLVEDRATAGARDPAVGGAARTGLTSNLGVVVFTSRKNDASG